MADTADRQNERGERVPLAIPIELGHGDFEDAFAADGVNLSKGGLSLRASCLPDPGSRLSVRFRCEPSGALISAQGEVVWAHLDGEHRGEFGLAFVDLDPESEWLIEEMIAEHSAREGNARSSADSGAQIAQLELEGSSEPIAARVVRSDGSSVVFEQRLDLLKLGRGVRAFGDSSRAHAGAISAVELRMVGSVPMLAVTVAFDGEAGTLPAPLPEHDTEPDLAAPAAEAVAAEDAPFAVREGATLMEFEGSPRHSRSAALISDLIADYDPPPPDIQIADDIELASAPTAVPAGAFTAGSRARAYPSAHALELDDDAHERPTLDPSAPAPRLDSVTRMAARAALDAPPARKSQPAPPPQLEPTIVVTTEGVARPSSHPPAPHVARAPRAPERPEPVADNREWSTSFKLDDRSRDPEPDPEQLELPPFEPEPPALLIALQQLSRVLRRQSAALGAATSRSLGALYRKASPEVRERVLRAGNVAGGVYADRIGPQIGAMRRLALGKLTGRRRRTTAAPNSAAQAAPGSGLGRTVLLGLLAAGAIGFGVYALAPAADDSPRLHRNVDPNALPSEPLAPVSATAPVDLASDPALVAPDPKVVPNAHAVPAASPFAVDVRGKAAAARKPILAAAVAAPVVATAPSAAVAAGSAVASAPLAAPAARKLRFGAASAPRGRRFALRMSGRIQNLSGSDDPGGFTVNIAGCLALDRAGPIASAHGAVERSMVINRGDHAELTIRFDQGKHPAYQVVAEGSTLYVTIQDL
jgi:hypothetical protein